MNRLECITEAYVICTGKSTLPTGTKRDKLNNLAKKLYRDWQTEPGMEWESLYSVVGAGTVTATDTFALDTEINFISTSQQRQDNLVRIRYGTSPNYSYAYYKSVPYGQLHRHRDTNAVSKVTDNSIKFSKAFTSTSEVFGGTIQVPAIIKLDDLTADTSEILIDNPAWLPARLAAQYVLTDTQLNYLYQDLLDQANELMLGMKIANGTGNESYSSGVDYFASMGNVI